MLDQNRYTLRRVQHTTGAVMIKHIVFLSFADAPDPMELTNVMSGLASLVGEIEGFVAFHHGPNIDVEGKSPEATYGFVCSFDTLGALHKYADDSRHQALGGRLVAMCDGVENIKVYDIDTGETQ